MAKQFKSKNDPKGKGFRSRKGKSFDKRDDARGRGSKILKDKRTDGMDERYAAETATPSMKNPNAGRNDASWYTYSPEVIAVAGTVNFNSPIGVPFSDTPTVLDDNNTQVAYATDPSVMRIAYAPTPGKVGTGGYPNLSTNAPVNLQIRSMYTLMQATVTQNLPFAAADLGIHIFYMDNVYMMWGHLQRLYYIWRKYDIMNRTVPKTLLKAYGLSEAVLHNPSYTLNDFQAELLLLEQEIRRIAIPSGFDILNRHYWMTKHIFMDEDSLKPQLYMFTPLYLWGFDDQGLTGGELVLNVIPTSSSSADGVKNLMTWFRTYLDDFYNDKDVWTLNGYVLRAFNNFWMPDPLDLAGIAQPVYQPEVLMQIHNATPAGGLFGARVSDSTNYHQQITAENSQHGRIYQDNKDNMVWIPAAVYNSSRKIGGALMDSRVMLDMPMPIPTPSDILVATRLITKEGNVVFTIDGTDCTSITEYGTEIVTHVQVFDGINDATGMVDLSQYSHWGLNIYDEGGPGLNIDQYEMLRISEISKFAYAPIFPLTIDHGGTVYGWYDFIGGMNNYTVVDSNVIRKLHDAAAMGEWLVK